MSHPFSNHLLHETSPYLQQHAHNPVEWYPWGQEALDRAKAESKPILVSIGYAACHWCHVMERESFENVATAALMNEYFINIKIDREERPDLDAIYMDAVQMISGSGGWPLNVFLTPDAKPFYGGTYFPPVRAYNRSSWPEVLDAIHRAWQDKPHELLAQAENLTDHIRDHTFFDPNKNATGFPDDQAEQIASNLLKMADQEWGGFGKAPKFPQAFSIQFLFRQSYFTQHSASIQNPDPALRQAVLSLDKMLYGGIYDQLAGGFARYSTDKEWLAPHFEKMLYDNALLISVMSEAYQYTGMPHYKTAVEQTMGFVKKYWQSSSGGFFSAYDADSEGVEGKYYTWSKSEIDEVLGDDAELFQKFYNVTEDGNWEGTNILWVKRPLDMFCKEKGLDIDETASRLADNRQRLLQIRDHRIPPLLDDKIILGWNALMITACCKAYAALSDTDYLEMAEKALHFIETNLKNAAGSLCHNYKIAASNPAFLDDMAFYIQSLIHMAEVTGNNDFLHWAHAYMEVAVKDFSDDGSPYFFYTPVWQTDVILRRKENHDGAVPSGNSTMAWNLGYLSVIFDRVDWKQRAEAMIFNLAEMVMKYPTSFGNWACILQQKWKGIDEIVISGALGRPILSNLLQTYHPNKIIQSQWDDTESLPLLKNRFHIDKTLIYLCKDYNCELPLDSLDQFWSLVKKKEQGTDIFDKGSAQKQ